MKSLFIKFLRQLLVFSAAAALLAIAAWLLLPGRYISPALPFLFPFFIGATLLSFHFLLGKIGDRFIRFVNAFMLTIVIKLLVYALVMVGYSLLNRLDAIAFMMAFFILYLGYTVFESVCIIRYTRSTGTESLR